MNKRNIILVGIISFTLWGCFPYNRLVVRDGFDSNFSCSYNRLYQSDGSSLQLNHIDFNEDFNNKESVKVDYFEYRSASPCGNYYVDFKQKKVLSIKIKRCFAELYDKSGKKLLKIKKVDNREPVIWFDNFLIFDGSNKLHRKILINFEDFAETIFKIDSKDYLVGRSLNKAYYTNNTDYFSVNDNTIEHKNSVFSIGVDGFKIEKVNYNPNDYYYFYNETNSIVLNSGIDSLTIYNNNKVISRKKTYSSTLPFDMISSSPDSCFLVCSKDIYLLGKGKFDKFLELKDLGLNNTMIEDIAVVDNNILFMSKQKITESNIMNKSFETKNGLMFLVKGTKYGEWIKKFEKYNEFGIISLDNKTVKYPELQIIY